MKALIITLALLATTAAAQTSPLTAAQSDPDKMGWMQGSPPPVDKQVRWDDASMWSFPRTRWSFSHWRNLGSGPIKVLASVTND